MTTLPTDETAALARAIRNALARLPVGRVRTALAAEATAVERQLGALTGSRARRGRPPAIQCNDADAISERFSVPLLASLRHCLARRQPFPFSERRVLPSAKWGGSQVPLLNRRPACL